MNKNRLEAFSDGVLAIIITIMVLEIKIPHGTDLAAIKPLIPVAFSYLFSFIYVGIYWNNHHHLFQVVKGVNGAILWGNLHLLFWISLLPFATGWIDENHFASLPVAFYGFILAMCGLAWKILTLIIMKHEGTDSRLRQVYKSDYKQYLSVVGYVSGIALSFYYPAVSVLMYVLVALIWFIPDRRIERNLKNH
ncbi:TMEM175 family protein [Chitinophaga sancti]|uniref:TMEM175 family protein n=1 Tax=Chitinophaga sancti TaxID=1004 RepID=A0A1K1RN72_9BACT|nr:TMEM175 family protein [Chitinophaga sancti]WQD62588.1 TMEM175 family protein [Chitinophaga sancti]WQG91843.1 TMEM175 family protein [Chitinophaga sancti]SFW73707.1 Uncharacterized membrane protein [Chitinophaga sancti]